MWSPEVCLVEGELYRDGFLPHPPVPHLDSQSSAGGKTVSQRQVQEQVATSVLQWLPRICRITLTRPQVSSVSGPCSSLQSHFRPCSLTQDWWFPGFTVPLQAWACGISWNVIHFPPTCVHLTSPYSSFKILFNITSSTEPFFFFTSPWTFQPHPLLCDTWHRPWLAGVWLHCSYGPVSSAFSTCLARSRCS